MLARPSPAQIADKLWRSRFHDALAIFCAGSVVRGEHTAHSDLDMVVLFDSIPNALVEMDPVLAAAFQSAFDAVFVNSDPQPLISFTERVLEPFGGPLFEGYRSDAPTSARAARPDLDV